MRDPSLRRLSVGTSPEDQALATLGDSSRSLLSMCRAGPFGFRSRRGQRWGGTLGGAHTEEFRGFSKGTVKFGTIFIVQSVPVALRSSPALPWGWAPRHLRGEVTTVTPFRIPLSLESGFYGSGKSTSSLFWGWFQLYDIQRGPYYYNRLITLFALLDL